MLRCRKQDKQVLLKKLQKVQILVNWIVHIGEIIYLCHKSFFIFLDNHINKSALAKSDEFLSIHSNRFERKKGPH